MTHLTKIALLGAVALLAAACAKEVETNNPNFNPETNEVVTQFVFNVSTQSGSATKMSADAVQASASNAFRGITDAKLLTYAETTSGKILPADKTASKIYDLSYVATAGTLSSTNSRRVLEMSLPLQTNTLLFYGRAPMGDPYGGYTNPYDCYGHMDVYDINENLGSADFQLGQRVNGAKYEKFKVVENLFAGIMTMLLNSSLPAELEIKANEAPAGVANKYKYNVTIPSGGIFWKDYDKIEDNVRINESPILPGNERFPLEHKLYTLYRQLTTVRNAQGELRAGSGEAVLRMAQDLFTVLNEVRCAEPLNEAETVAKYLANKVYDRMRLYFTADFNNNGAPITGVAFLSQADIVANYLSADEVATRPSNSDPNDKNVWPDADKLATISGYVPADFPFNFDLPRGATHIAFDATKSRFYYPQTFNVSGMGVPGTGDTYNAQSYYYPAELMYFGNSPIRTSNSDVVASAYPNGAGTADGQWDANASWGSNWDGNQVAAATRAVAMTYDINYGVAMLETKVKYGATTLKDNNKHVQDLWDDGIENDSTSEQDQDITVTGDSFKLTGVIIGGQSQRVGWEYLPVKVGDSFKYGFIYDKAIPEAAQAIPTSTPNYTLVFDNFHAASESGGIYTPENTQDIVYVALEFRNNSGKDFYGNENLIRKDGYFYLIGGLNPANATNTISWPDNVTVGKVPYFIPPYTAAGGSQRVPRVFIQDFKTTAEFVLGVNSLKAAYLTVPDLRSSSMTLGLSVNLSWETGLNFEDVILGGGSQ